MINTDRGKIQVCGSTPMILTDVTTIVYYLKNNLGISEKNIYFAVELGLKTEEEADKQYTEAIEKLASNLNAEELEELLKNIENELKGGN